MDQLRMYQELKGLWDRNVLDKEVKAWLDHGLKVLEAENASADLYKFFNQANRFLSKNPLDAETLLRFPVEEALRRQLKHFTVLQLGRLLLLIVFQNAGKNEFLSALKNLLQTSGLEESKNIFMGFPYLMRYSEHLAPLAVEGIRTNMTDVFDALVLDNPYPSRNLNEDQWNQLFLKAAFMDRPIYRILGARSRINSTLNQMISDYAHERWSAGRILNPEIWSGTGASWPDSLARDMEKVGASPDLFDRRAAQLACSQSNDPRAEALLEEWKLEKVPLSEVDHAWVQFGKEFWQERLQQRKG